MTITTTVVIIVLLINKNLSQSTCVLYSSTDSSGKNTTGVTGYICKRHFLDFDRRNFAFFRN